VLLALPAPSPAASPAAPEPAASTPATAPGTWQVTEGRLTFRLKQMGQEVEGSFPAWTAAITFDPATGLGRVTVAIDTTSLVLGAVTDQAKAPEFFDVAAFPSASFTAEIAPTAQGHAATGTLTLRGTDRPLTLPFTLQIDGDTAQMKGEVTLDRRDFGMGASYKDESSVGFAVTVSVALTATR
uniref:YceI family protein n=1 Tax=Xinfangfangia pollutisoli TaxID=2865960 RepID=UPI001CD51EDC